jgi:hypothetical protein
MFSESINDHLPISAQNCYLNTFSDKTTETYALIHPHFRSSPCCTCARRCDSLSPGWDPLTLRKPVLSLPPSIKRIQNHFLSSPSLQGVVYRETPSAWDCHVPLLCDFRGDEFPLWDSVSPKVNEGSTGKIWKAVAPSQIPSPDWETWWGRGADNTE